MRWRYRLSWLAKRACRAFAIRSAPSPSWTISCAARCRQSSSAEAQRAISGCRWRGGRSALAEDAAEEGVGLGVDARSFAFARAGDTDGIGPLPLADKAHRQHARSVAVHVDDDVGLAEFPGRLDAETCSLRHRQPGAVDEHHQPVGIADIPFGALAWIGFRRLA